MKRYSFLLTFPLCFLLFSCSKDSKLQVIETDDFSNITLIDSGSDAIVSKEVKLFYPDCKDLVLIEEAENTIANYWGNSISVIDAIDPIYLDNLYNLSPLNKIAIVVEGVENKNPKFHYFSYSTTLLNDLSLKFGAEHIFCFVADRTFYDGGNGSSMPDGFRPFTNSNVMITLGKEKDKNCILMLSNDAIVYEKQARLNPLRLVTNQQTEELVYKTNPANRISLGNKNAKGRSGTSAIPPGIGAKIPPPKK